MDFYSFVWSEKVFSESSLRKNSKLLWNSSILFKFSTMEVTLGLTLTCCNSGKNLDFVNFQSTENCKNIITVLPYSNFFFDPIFDQNKLLFSTIPMSCDTQIAHLFHMRNSHYINLIKIPARNLCFHHNFNRSKITKVI